MNELDIKKIEYNRPHVELVGAGATVATIPNGDKYGMPCSVMNNFIKNLGLESLFRSVTLTTKSTNIEDIYSELYDRGEECMLNSSG